MKVEVAVLSSTSLIVVALMVTVDVKATVDSRIVISVHRQQHRVSVFELTLPTAETEDA